MPRRDRSTAISERAQQLLARAVLAFGRVPGRANVLGRARGILHIFALAEKLSEYGHVIRPLRPGGITRYEIARFSGADLPLPSGPPVRHGERVLILHFDNRTLASLNASSPQQAASPWRVFTIARQDFRLLARLIEQGAIPADVRTLWGETVFYPALARLGFATRPIRRPLYTPFARLFMLSLIAIYGGNGLRRATEREPDHFQLGEAWMSIGDFVRRFGDAP